VHSEEDGERVYEVDAYCASHLGRSEPRTVVIHSLLELVKTREDMILVKEAIWKTRTD
jgi:hypothetical protein